MPPWLLLGCGYTGEAVVRLLPPVRGTGYVVPEAQVRGTGYVVPEAQVRGTGYVVPRVVAARRDEGALAAMKERCPGLLTAAVDVRDVGAVRGVVEEGAIVVVLYAPVGNEGAVVEAIAAGGAARLVYVSSTGVYAAGGGRGSTRTGRSSR